MRRNMRKSERKHHKGSLYVTLNRQASIKKEGSLPMSPSLVPTSKSMLYLRCGSLDTTPGHLLSSGLNCKLLMERA